MKIQSDPSLLNLTAAHLLHEIRCDLSVAARWIAKLGLHEGVNNHLSVRLDDHFLINPYGLSFEELYPNDLITVPLHSDQVTLEQPNKVKVEKTALTIHGAIHKQIEDAYCVIHTHMPYATALASLEDMTLPMINQNGVRFYQSIAYETDYNGLAHDTSEGEKFSDLLVDKKVLLLANHGVIITGASIAEALHNTYYFEQACQNYIIALSTGRKLNIIPDDVANKASVQMKNDHDYAYQLLRSAHSYFNSIQSDSSDLIDF
jgi:ribulose-5-phosphate 4-epimerase/fuculose-1-phosphate aldolase